LAKATAGSLPAALAMARKHPQRLMVVDAGKLEDLVEIPHRLRLRHAGWALVALQPVP